MSTGIYEKQQRWDVFPLNEENTEEERESHLLVGEDDAPVAVQSGLEGESSQTDVVLQVDAAPLHHQRSAWKQHKQNVDSQRKFKQFHINIVIKSRLFLTVIKIKHSRVCGQARVEVSHQRSDVLSGSEHPVDYISCANETWERKEHWGSRRSSVESAESHNIGLDGSFHDLNQSYDVALYQELC